MEFVISIFALAASVVAVVFSIITHNEGVKRERRQATLDAFNVLQCQVLDKLQEYKNADIIEIVKNPRSTRYKELSALLARCEHFAVGVNQKIYDLETVRRLAAEHLVAVYTRLLPLIQKKRQYQHNENRYREFEELAQKLGFDSRKNMEEK